MVEVGVTNLHGKHFQGKAWFLEMVVKNKILGGPKQRKKSSRTRNIPKNMPKIRKTIRPEYQKIKHMCLKFSLEIG